VGDPPPCAPPRLPAEGIEFYEDGSGFDLRQDWQEVERLLDEHEPKLVVLDSLRSLAPGLEENDSGDTEAAIGPIRRLAHDRNIAVILIHHTSKPGHTYRGNTAIMAAVDIAYRLGRAEGDTVPERRSLVCKKMRIGPEPPTRWLNIEFEHGMVLVSEAEPHETEEVPRPAPVRDKLVPQVEAVVREQGPIRLANIARELDRDPKDQSVRRALGALNGVEQDEDGRWRVSGVTPPSRGDTVTPAPSVLDELEAALTAPEKAGETDGPALVSA
jgi:hypothetical protein